MKEKIFLLVLDGIGDRGNRTSLKIARKKNLDWFAENGICGIMDPIAPGIRPGSDTAHLSILGYNPYEIYTGRGPFEAAGVGMKIDSGDVALRCNFATVASDMTIIDRRAGRINEGTKELAKAIDGMELNGIKIRVKEGTEHRATLVLSGKGLSQKITDIDPHSDGMKVQKAKSLEKNAELTARVLNEFVLRSYRILDQHKINIEREKKGLKKANILLPRGAGIMPKIKNFNEKFNLSSCAIAGVGLIKGICSLLGMKIIEVKGATGGLDTDIDAKIEKGRDALKKYDFVFINIKAPDICGHDFNEKSKVEVIERIDKAVGILRELEDAYIIITSDHSTPVTVGDHTADPVPLLIYGKGVRKDKVKKFNEEDVSYGSLHRIKGNELLQIVLDLANRTEKFGA